MVKCHRLIDDSNFNDLIDIEIANIETKGFVSKKVLKVLFDVFSWVYIEGDAERAFTEESEFKELLSNFNLELFKGESLCYSSVLFYNKLNKLIDIRELEKNKVTKLNKGGNKLFSSRVFKYKALYEMYANSIGDLSNDFLLFNKLFRKKDVKKVTLIENYSDITNVNSINNLVRPDFKYNLATKKLLVNKREEKEVSSDNKLYVLQDATYSISSYLENIKVIKAFILNEAFINNFEVEWLFISDRINDRILYTKSNLSNIDITFPLSGTKIDTSQILTRDEFIDKQVIIITDGTDSFNFPFNTKTKKINVISFRDNKNIKNKILNHGKFFKIEG